MTQHRGYGAKHPRCRAISDAVAVLADLQSRSVLVEDTSHTTLQPPTILLQQDMRWTLLPQEHESLELSRKKESGSVEHAALIFRPKPLHQHCHSSHTAVRRIYGTRHTLITHYTKPPYFAAQDRTLTALRLPRGPAPQCATSCYVFQQSCLRAAQMAKREN